MAGDGDRKKVLSSRALCIIGQIHTFNCEGQKFVKLFYFRLNIPYQAFQQLYTTPNTVVKVRDEAGRTIQLPAMRFVPFFSQLGVRGRFQLMLDENNKFQKLTLLNQ